MILSRRFLQTVLLMLTVFTAGVCGIIREGSFTANSDGSSITLRWVSEDESSALRYEIERKAGATGQFVFIAEVVLRGNNSTYVYIDDSAFRPTESIYQYRIKVVLANGTSVYYGPITVTHKVSSVRRTWGSIKAMFR